MTEDYDVEDWIERWLPRMVTALGWCAVLALLAFVLAPCPSLILVAEP